MSDRQEHSEEDLETLVDRVLVLFRFVNGAPHFDFKSKSTIAPNFFLLLIHPSHPSPACSDVQAKTCLRHSTRPTLPAACCTSAPPPMISSELFCSSSKPVRFSLYLHISLFPSSVIAPSSFSLPFTPCSFTPSSVSLPCLTPRVWRHVHCKDGGHVEGRGHVQGHRNLLQAGS
jgi:hypothetical protein